MVRKVNLLLIASIVWLIAGFNVLKIGIDSYATFTKPLNYGLSLIVFASFWFMVFSKLERKHNTRILAYEMDKLWFFHFFDLKSFIIMAIMMGGGVTIRVMNLLPDRFIAVFYTGLGAALFLAGILFGIDYVRGIRRTGQCAKS
ncbi:hypothetical protein [Lacticaseibacillus kribbianus]|uniref:hypothetical protein n=1 Tax=Lacticaseibacillus kribbianus TaxID=2926292 RepID=UPI001CD55721|nr:hypothetical protein [Lacticaseibacillus kribbianus]